MTTDAALNVKLFGRFSCNVADRRVAFVRRRDQNLLTYIALAADCRVTREELLETFWPGLPRAEALGGLRTAICRLRRALSAAAGCDAGRFIRVDDSIALILEHVTIDARLFKAQVERAVVDDAVGDHAAARAHYALAERLYTSGLLASEAIDPMLLPQTAEFSVIFDDVLAYLARRGPLHL